MIKNYIDKEEINKLPPYEFETAFTLISSPDERDLAAEKILNCPVLGFDTETRPSFRKGQSYKISLLQLSTNDHVYLFRLNKMEMGSRLIRVLEDENIVKSGVAIRDDVKGLRKLTPFQPRGFVELADRAKDLNLKNFGLRNMAALVLGKSVSKAGKLTNWENKELTVDQQKYAAIDAWIGRELYLAMKDLKPFVEKDRLGD